MNATALILKGSNLKRKPTTLRHLRTEQSNHAADDLDQKSPLDIARLINAEDATVALFERRRSNEKLFASKAQV